MAARESGGWLTKSGRAKGTNITGVVSSVENVEGGHSGREDSGFVIPRFGEVEVMVVEKIERGYSARPKRVSAYASRTRIAEAGVKEVITGGFIVRKT